MAVLSHPCRFLNLRRPRATLTPHEFERTRAARPRPDLGGDDLADLGTTGWYVGRFSTDKHLSIGKAHAVLPKTGLYWPPVVGPCGPPSVAAVRVAGVLAGGPFRWCPSAVLAVGPWLVSVRGRGGRFRGPWRPFGRPLVHWSAVVLSWSVAARLGLVCLPCQLVAFRRRLWPVAAGVRCWSLRALLRRRRSRWPCRWPSLLVSLVSVSLRRAVARGPCRWPPVWAAVWRCAGGVIAPCLVGPCAVSVRPCWCPPWRSLAVRPSLLVCWCAVGGWRSFLAVFRGRGGPFGPSVVLVSVAGPCGPCGPCFGPC